MKTCKGCFRELELEMFYKHPLTLDGRMGKCMECVTIYRHQHHKDSKRQVREALAEFKRDKSCSVCNKPFPHYILRFKRLTPGILISHIRSVKRLYRELPYCQLMCANCLEIASITPDDNPSVVRQMLYEYKASNPCLDCGNFFPYPAMSFHHLDPTTKLFDMAQAGKLSDLAEIDKCVLLCMNCHMEREWGLNGSRRLLF